jgi:DNA-binding MarR family transcriptional regulator
LDNSTTSRHIHGLVEKEFVQRLPDPNDRRFVTLDLTDRGIALEKEISDIMAAYIEGIFKQLPEGRLHSLSSELRLLTEAMGKSEFCCKPPL